MTTASMSEKIQSLLLSQNTEGTDIWINILHMSHQNPTKEFESTFMKPLLEEQISPFFLSFLSNRKLEKYSSQWNYQPKMLCILLMTKQMMQKKKTKKLIKDEFMEIDQPLVDDIVPEDEIKEDEMVTEEEIHVEVAQNSQEDFEVTCELLDSNQTETQSQESEEIENKIEREIKSEEFQNNDEIVGELDLNIETFSFQNEEIKNKNELMFPEMKIETIENSINGFQSSPLENLFVVSDVKNYERKRVTARRRSPQKELAGSLKIEQSPLKFTFGEINHKEIVREEVKKSWTSLSSLASEEMKNDKEIVMEAVKKSWTSLQYASEEIKNDKEFMMEAVKIEPATLQYASEEMKNDKEIVLEVVKKSWTSLEYASNEIKNNKEFMMEAVKIEPATLQYASEEMKNDKEIVMEAVKMSPYTLKFASEELQILLKNETI
jgi:CxxC motif-containing protein